MGQLISAADFRNLSAQLNYQLSGDPVLWPAVLRIMLEDGLAKEEEELLLASLECLGTLYGEHRRRLGPFAVLHPIRTAALLSIACGGPPRADQLFITFFHDKYEDLTQDKVGKELWQIGELSYQKIMIRLSEIHRIDLDRQVLNMARTGDENYCEYIGRLLGRPGGYGGLVALKLADRLDNTFDLTMEPSRLAADLDCYKNIFEVLFFLKRQQNSVERLRHPAERKINGAMRLYQLFKNTLLLSLLRSEKVVLDEVSKRLFIALAKASSNEAQSVLLHIFTFHLQGDTEQREILQEVMAFCESGGLERVSTKTGHRLDRLFVTYFNFLGAEKKERLAEFYNDKKFMGEAALAFLAIFNSFLNDPGFRISGISPQGIKTVL